MTFPFVSLSLSLIINHFFFIKFLLKLCEINYNAIFCNCFRNLRILQSFLFLKKYITKYFLYFQITNNIRKIFKKFITDGKVTISLIEPCHDLIIQGNAVQLESFLNILKHIKNGLCKGLDKYVLKSNTTFKSNDFCSLEKVVVKKKSEYPILQGFPRTTKELVLSGLDRKSFDRQILTLQSLRVLNLSNNKISFLPKELGTLPHLRFLDLSHNNLGKSVRSKWAWLEQTALRRNLCFLDISNNLVSCIIIVKD